VTNEELKTTVIGIVPDTNFDETGEFLTANVDAKELLPLMEELRNRKELNFNYLFCLTCVDWKSHLTMVYHLISKSHKHQLVVKVQIDDVGRPEIESVSGIWKTAIYHEREVFDLFGVKFRNHPDLRRIFLDEDWPGNPLRKNYVDENMIEL